jgi:hypothetical protein
VAALERYRADVALAPAPLPSGDLSGEWVRLLEEQQTTVRAAQPGMRLRLDGAVLTILAAGDGGEARLALRLDYGATGVLLDGDGSAGADAALLAGVPPPVAVLAYPWQREPDTRLLNIWQPRAIIFTTGYESDMPALHTFYERAQGNPALYHHLYHPELDGTLELVSNGQRACVRRASEPPCM